MDRKFLGQYGFVLIKTDTIRVIWFWIFRIHLFI